MSVTVVNPLQLLRELFTVSGAGTLIRKGCASTSRDGWSRRRPGAAARPVDSAFGTRRSAPISSSRPIARTFVEEHYRGAAVVAETPARPYLTKFAVERQAQGEGIGGEIWSLVTRDYPAFFWRSRPENPITAWYVKQCDGLRASPSGTSSGAASRRDDRAGRPTRARRRERLRLGGRRRWALGCGSMS